MKKLLISLICIILIGCSNSDSNNSTQTNTEKFNDTITAVLNRNKQLQFNTPSETTSPTLTIPGKVSTQSKVFINDQELLVERDGSFTAVLRLVEGQNTIPIRVVSPNSRYSSSIMIEYHESPKKPNIEIGLKDFYNYSHIFIEGQTDPGNLVTINNMPVTILEDGYFLTETFLTQGNHIVTIQATNKDKISTTIQRKVSVVYPLKQPALVVSIPHEPGFVSADRINITGFSDPYCIVEIYNNYFNSNGQEILSMISSAVINSSGKFAAEVYLNPGPNTLTIRAIDRYGSVKEEVRKLYCKNNTFQAYNIPKGYSSGYKEPNTERLRDKYGKAYDHIDEEDR